MSSAIQITIKKTMEKNLEDMAANVQFKTIETLSQIYGFNLEDAIKQIGLEINKPEKKITNKTKLNTPSVPLPWCGEVNHDWCCGLRNNGGLQTQCMMSKIDGGKFCKTCQKQSEKEGNNGKPNYGEVNDRTSLAPGVEYAGAKGKKPLKYSVIMAKKGISREEAEREAAKLGWTIPESEFEPVSKKMTKKKKMTTVSDTESDTDSDSDSIKPKKRGRPTKKKVVKNDDAIANIVDNLSANSSSSDDSETEKPKKKEKKVKKEKKEKKEKKVKKEKKEKKELTEEEKLAKKAETNRKRKETREKNKAKKEAEEKASKLEGKELEEKIDQEIKDLDISSDDESVNSSDKSKNDTKEEEDIVECTSDETVVIVINDKSYLMEKGDSEKCLYDKETGECVGTYDDENNTVKPIADIDSDSDDE